MMDKETAKTSMVQLQLQRQPQQQPPSKVITCETTTTTAHVVKIHVSHVAAPSSIRISVNGSEPTAVIEPPPSKTTGYYFYNCMSSGQVSPSETLDSGTGSDLDGGSSPPPQPKKPAIICCTPHATKKPTAAAASSGAVSITMIGGGSSTTPSPPPPLIDSDDTDSNLSCDSLSSNSTSAMSSRPPSSTRTVLPNNLLQDIRLRATERREDLVRSYEERRQKLTNPSVPEENEATGDEENTDSFYNFHLNERVTNSDGDCSLPLDQISKLNGGDDETFAGYKDILCDHGSSTIRSAKGTVRGVKNRVRAGIATFLQINSNVKSYREKDAGKVVVYTTTMGILRDTYQACMKVKQILRTLMVKFEERDVFMSNEFQGEIRERMRSDTVLVPQVFVDGQHVGDAESIEKLNESGELRRILKPYKSLNGCSTCQVCGGYRLLPCQVCNGSKKSVHRNHFTTEFVALKCMNCDEVGLVRCTAC